jgi:hypothetical protein
MTKRISTPRRLIRIGTTRRIISSVAFPNSCPPPSGIGILSDKQMPESVRSTRLITSTLFRAGRAPRLDSAG